jgi:hypothetical protein
LQPLNNKSNPSLRRNGRVVECTGLENQRTARYRGFESLFLRISKKHRKVLFLCPIVYKK